MPFDQVMDFSVIQKLGQDEKYSSSKVEYETKVAPKELQAVRAEGEEILTNTVVIHFFPNSFDPMKTVSRTVNGKTVEERYDPNVENVLEEIAQLAGQFGTARIIIEGHTDASMKGQVPVEAVKDLSLKRANAIKEALLKKYTDLDPNRFNVDGVGWDRPGRPAEPDQEPPGRDQGAHRREGELRGRDRRWQSLLQPASGHPVSRSMTPPPPRPAGRGEPCRLRSLAPGDAHLAGGVHGPGLALRLLRTLVVRDRGRAGRADHFAVEGAFEPGRNIRELSQSVV